jgi:FkbM family methyltransferase
VSSQKQLRRRHGIATLACVGTAPAKFADWILSEVARNCRFHQKKWSSEANVAVWGTGKSSREFMYVDDMVDALCIPT